MNGCVGSLRVSTSKLIAKGACLTILPSLYYHHLQWCGANAITRSTTAAWHYGSVRTTAVHCVNRSGLSSESASETPKPPYSLLFMNVFE